MVSFLIGFAAPIAASAFGSASYLLAPLGLSPTTAWLAHRGLASVAIVAFALIHTSKASHAARAHSTVTLLKLGILATFLVAGLYAGWGRWENLADRASVDLGTASAMLFSLVYISYAYTGWNAASYLAGEIAEPGRRLPQAILIGTSLVVALYWPEHGVLPGVAGCRHPAHRQGTGLRCRRADRRAGGEAYVRLDDHYYALGRLRV